MIWGGIYREMRNQQISIFAYIPDPREVEEYNRLISKKATERTQWETRRLSYLHDRLEFYDRKGNNAC